MARLVQRGCAFGAMTAAISLMAISSSGEEVAPRPIEYGEWYLGASGGIERIRTPEFKALRLYVDNSAVTGNNTVTIEDPQGYLLEHRIKSSEKIPAVYFGYGFAEGAAEDAVYRVEVSLEAYDRKESFDDDFIPLPDETFAIDAPPPDERAGLLPYYIPIDGKGNADDDAAYLSDSPILFEEFKIKEYSRSGSLSLYFDSRNGPWVFSRGVSVSYSYLKQEIDHEYITLLPLNDPAITDPTSFFRYRSKSHSVGSRLHYSAGYEVVQGWSIFTHGRFGFFARYTDLEGKQDAPCLTVCDLTGDVYTRGTRKIEIDAWKFAYDVRMGFGTSLRVGPIRLTAHGGGTRIGGWTTPREKENGVKIATSGGWGYFATASAGIAF
ncbi:MAG: hypothetical protein JRE71_10220 [Deltaproteobacteria bacterium]|nr:hypothetical protein [Deltaproteobacteria bacterium]